ncbi:MAG: hypothetical protein KGN84_16190, partial [Acidobacteriota bacterium]|nr:hypothetical protein [Acidobacteriota bacterium]
AGQGAQTQGAFSEGATFHFGGRHVWKHDQLGISYNAGYIRYGSQAYGYSGLNQTLAVDYTHMISSHLEFTFVESLARFTQGGALSNPLEVPGVNVANLNLSVSSSLQPYDLIYHQTSTQTGITWQKSARLSFSYTAGIFGVARAGPYSVGNAGFQASTDMNYRLTRKTTLGASYAYTTFSFSHGYASAASHTVDMIYSYALGRSTEFRSRFGFSTFQNNGLTSVPVDPTIAALTGQALGIVEIRRRSNVPDISAQLVRDFHGKHTASLSYARGISPGNGYVLTAVQESYGISYGTKIFRRYDFALSGGKSSLRTSLGATPLGGFAFSSEWAGVNVSRSLQHNISANFMVSYRRYDASGLLGVLPQIVIGTGISWGPGEGRLW